MKKIFFFTITAIALCSCSSNSSKSTTANDSAAADSSTLKAQAVKPGEVQPDSAEKDPPLMKSSAPVETAGNEVFTKVEVEPVPKGGLEAFYKFLSDKIKYPPAAKEAGTQGRVILQFIVEKDGNLTNIMVVREPGNGLGNEAVRVVKLAPKWTPGIQNGKPVRVQYTIPVNFSLGDQ